MIDGRADIVRRVRRRGGVSADPIRTANDLTAAHAPTSEEAEETRAPVIAARNRRRRSPADSRRAAELAQQHHEGFVQQAGRLQIVEQRGDSLVQRRQQPIAKRGEQVAV